LPQITASTWPRPQLQLQVQLTGEPAVLVDSSSDLERSEQEQPAVYLLGLGLGLFATATSVIGLLWRIDLVSLLIAGLIAIAPVVFACRQFRFRSTVSSGMNAVVIALLPVLAWAAFLPPYSWDEVAYGAALPRDYARVGHFFYNDDYGPYSAFPGNYEALTTAALVLFQSASAMKCLNLLLAIGLAAIAAHLCRALRAPKLCWPLAAALVLSAPVVCGVVPMVKNDVANAFFQCLAIMACVRYLAVETRLANLQSQETPDDFMRVFRALGLTMLAIFPWDPETEGYGAAANPHYHEFVTRLYRAVVILQRTGRLELVTVVNGVFVFRILNPAP
jgi:hypothetical protein